MYADLDLPDEDFDYEYFVAREFGNKPHHKIGVKSCRWCLEVLVLVLWMLATFSTGYSSVELPRRIGM